MKGQMKAAKNSPINNMMKSTGKVILKSKPQEKPLLKKDLGVVSFLKGLLWHKPLNLVKSPKIKEMWHKLKTK